MKLYTEEQVRKAYNEGCWNGFNEVSDKEDFTINSLKPIELPSDEEIEEMGKDVIVYNDTKRGWFIEGLKFMRDKILNK
jgi:hypothetical protein